LKFSPLLELGRNLMAQYPSTCNCLAQAAVEGQGVRTQLRARQKQVAAQAVAAAL
jgi:hypothetical protein